MRTDQGHYTTNREIVQERGWTRFAKCANDPEITTDFFFPESATSRTHCQYCNDCPVRRVCLAYALLVSETHGIWGGTTERERRNLLHLHKADDIIASVFGEPATRRARRPSA